MGFCRAPLPLAILALLGTAPVFADDLFVDTQALPEVLTATRLKQAPAAVPGSITVLDAGLIKASGARDLAELLRLVPGMMIGYRNGNQATANYHGSNVTEARRLQVLVDGRSVYRPGLASVDWNDIPVALEDIERIEVFRGPNSVSYGANALMGVINILTRAPADSQGTRLKVTQGQRGIRDWYASQGLSGDASHMRLSLSGLEDTGFDHNAAGQDYRDGRRVNRFQLSSSHLLDERQTVDWQLAAKEGTNQRPYSYQTVFGARPPQGQDSDLQAKDYAASTRWTLDLDPDHSIQVQGQAQHWERQQEWQACEAAIAFSPQLGQLYELSSRYTQSLLQGIRQGRLQPPPGSPEQLALASEVLRQLANGGSQRVCGDIDHNIRETRYELELQDTYSLSDTLRLVSGLSYRYDRTQSQTFLNGALDNELWRLFGHLEWRLDEHWLLQGGAMLESDQLSGSSLSPRLALNYLITPRHGLRAVYSEAVRSPDMFENQADWRYQVSNLSPVPQGHSGATFFMRARGPGDLEQELMRSRELGYNGYFPSLALSMDLKLFYDEISQMISEPLRINDFAPSNNNQIRFSGAEAQLDWQASLTDRLRLTYAYVDASASSALDQRLTARHSGSAGWLHDWSDNWSSALFYYGADVLNEHRFERLDLRLSKKLHLGPAQLELAGTLQQRLDDEPTTWGDNRYDARHLLYFSAELEF
ncbi:MAG: TonB-dependent receptor [Pseudomonas sp.]|uniref:TonB-dependent receptor plug domain-containing protein n=1 Tax=Pseudomonas sp. TaxID=306 RepID=UPI0033936B31